MPKKEYRCEHGTLTATRTASGVWIGHATCFQCLVQHRKAKLAQPKKNTLLDTSTSSTTIGAT